MAKGDIDDIASRLNTQVPPSWFPSGAPVVASLLRGFANAGAYLYSLIALARLQTRLATATGFFLDLFAFDYIGRRLSRRPGETDAMWRARIKAEILRERVTKKGMIQAITDLVGRAPIVFEPWNPNDAGAWDNGVFAYDTAGGWGDTNLPNQCFVAVKRPGLQGVPGVAGWDNGSLAAYDIGSWEYIDQTLVVGAVTDQDIYDTINATKPVGSVVWTQLL